MRAIVVAVAVRMLKDILAGNAMGQVGANQTHERMAQNMNAKTKTEDEEIRIKLDDEELRHMLGGNSIEFKIAAYEAIIRNLVVHVAMVDIANETKSRLLTNLAWARLVDRTCRAADLIGFDGSLEGEDVS
jgi:uncharacterized membrane protein